MTARQPAADYQRAHASQGVRRINVNLAENAGRTLKIHEGPHYGFKVVEGGDAGSRISAGTCTGLNDGVQLMPGRSNSMVGGAVVNPLSDLSIFCPSGTTGSAVIEVYIAPVQENGGVVHLADKNGKMPSSFDLTPAHLGVTVTGTSAEFVAADALLSEILIQNQDTAESVFMRIGAAATADKDSVEILPSTHAKLSRRDGIRSNGVNLIRGGASNVAVHIFTASEG